MWFSVKAREASVLSLLFGFSSHSQTTMTCQPIAASFFCSSLSRSLFLWIFFSQKSVFVFGIRKYLHPSCPCQKHPLTKIQVRYLRSTRSGWPGRRGLFKRYRKPSFHKYLRTSTSGFVSFERIAAMFLCRCMVVKGSVMVIFCISTSLLQS